MHGLIVSFLVTKKAAALKILHDSFTLLRLCMSKYDNVAFRTDNGRLSKAEKKNGCTSVDISS